MILGTLKTTFTPPTENTTGVTNVAEMKVEKECPCNFCVEGRGNEAERKLEEEGEGEAESWKLEEGAAPTPPDPMKEAWENVIDRLRVLRDRKGKDYGTMDDSIKNLRAAEEFGIPAWVGCVIRANDKMRRLQTFISQGRLSCEPADDALEDLVNYIVWAIVLREEAMFPPGKVTSFD